MNFIHLIFKLESYIILLASLSVVQFKVVKYTEAPFITKSMEEITGSSFRVSFNKPRSEKLLKRVFPNIATTASICSYEIEWAIIDIDCHFIFPVSTR